MADIQLAVVDNQDVQIAVIDGEHTQLALAQPSELSVNIAVPGIQGPTGVGFPATGGTINQLLVKNSSADFDASWSSTLDTSQFVFDEGTY